ncbi:MAG: hypothetical protein ACFE8V_10880 [Promethearchaeota archaeon]
MVNLKKLTVPLLDKLAEECGISFNQGEKKAAKISKIKNAGIPENHLEELVSKYLKQKSLSKRTNKDTILELKGRIKLLEEQVKFLMSKISVSEVKISKDENRDIITITSNLGDIKNFIKSILLPGESLTVDELIEMKQLQKIPLITLKHAIYDLIEEGLFDVSEGTSRQKIAGRIGVIKRR